MFEAIKDRAIYYPFLPTTNAEATELARHIKDIRLMVTLPSDVYTDIPQISIAALTPTSATVLFGLASATCLAVVSGSPVTVYSTGVLVSAYVHSAGQLIVSSGGSAIDTVLSEHGTITIHSGATVQNTTLRAQGYINVSGGDLTNTAIRYGGILNVYTSGTTTATTIEKGGIQNVNSGGVALQTVVNGGLLQLLRGGSCTSVVISSGRLQITSTANASDVVVLSGGSIAVAGYGLLTSATISSGGELFFSPNGSGADITIHTGGRLGGIAFATEQTPQINAAGTASIQGPDENFFITPITGLTSAIVASGGTATNITVFYPCRLFIDAFGTCSRVRVDSSGTMSIASEGEGNNVTVAQYGTVTIDDDGVCSSLHVDRDGTLNAIVFPATYHIKTYREGYGTISGVGELKGSALQVTGNASGFCAVSGGLIEVLSGGSAIDLTAIPSGNISIYEGATAEQINLHGGTLTIADGGSASVKYDPWMGSISSETGATITYLDRDANVYIGSRNTYISKTDIVQNATIAAHWSTIVYNKGRASNVTINSSGTLIVESGGVAKIVKINQAGVLIVLSGGTAVTVSSGANAVVTVSDGGYIEYA